MPRCIRVEMTGRASRANVMNMFTEKEEKRVASSQRQEHRPPRTATQTFRQNCKDCCTEKRSGCETDQRTEWLVRQLQRRTDPSTDKGESIRRDNLPERVNHLGACASRRRGMIFPAMLCLDGNVNQFVVAAKQRSIGIAALWLVRDNRNHCRIFSDADLPDMQISYQRIAIAFHCAANLIRQIRGCRCAIEQDAAGVPQQRV